MKKHLPSHADCQRYDGQAQPNQQHQQEEEVRIGRSELPRGGSAGVEKTQLQNRREGEEVTVLRRASEREHVHTQTVPLQSVYPCWGTVSHRSKGRILSPESSCGEIHVDDILGRMDQNHSNTTTVEQTE